MERPRGTSRTKALSQGIPYLEGQRAKAGKVVRRVHRANEPERVQMRDVEGVPGDVLVQVRFDGSRVVGAAFAAGGSGSGGGGSVLGALSVSSGSALNGSILGAGYSLQTTSTPFGRGTERGASRLQRVAGAENRAVGRAPR